MYQLHLRCDDVRMYARTNMYVTFEIGSDLPESIRIKALLRALVENFRVWVPNPIYVWSWYLFHDLCLEIHKILPKKCGCHGTHGTHTNDDPVVECSLFNKRTFTYIR